MAPIGYPETRCVITPKSAALKGLTSVNGPYKHCWKAVTNNQVYDVEICC